MRLYNLTLITALSFFAIYTSAQNNVTFQVDMSTVDSSTIVEVTPVKAEPSPVK